MLPALGLPAAPTPCVRRRAQSGQPLRFPKTMHGRYPWFGGPPDARIGRGNGSFVVKIQSLGRHAAHLGGIRRLAGTRRLTGIFGKRRVAEVAGLPEGGAEYGEGETTSPRILDEASVQMVREAGTARSESRSGRNVNGTLNAVLGAMIVVVGVFATLAYTSSANFQRGINDRVGGLGDQIGGLGDQIDSLGDRVDSLGDRVDRLSERVDGLSERVDRLSERVAENSRAIAANTAAIAANTAAIEANARAIAANTAAIAANTRSIEEVRQGVTENTRLIYQVIERIARIEGILESHFGTLAPLPANSAMPATLRTPARSAARRAESLSPMIAMAAGGGPIKTAPKSSTADAKSAISLKKS